MVIFRITDEALPWFVLLELRTAVHVLHRVLVVVLFVSRGVTGTTTGHASSVNSDVSASRAVFGWTRGVRVIPGS